MASFNGPPATTDTTTSTTTSTNVTIGRRVRDHSQSLGPASPPVRREGHSSYDVFLTPRTSNPNNVGDGTEPFPSFPADPRSSQLSQTQSIDQYPTSIVSSTTRRPRAVTAAGPTPIHRRPIGIKRLSSFTPRPPRNEASGAGAPQPPAEYSEQVAAGQDGQNGGQLANTANATGNLPAVAEGEVATGRPDANVPSRARGGSQRLRRLSDAARSAVSRLSVGSGDKPQLGHEYEDGIVDILDVLDPEVSTLTTLTNVQNSLFVPDLGRWLNRRPTFELTHSPSYRAPRPASQMAQTPGAQEKRPPVVQRPTFTQTLSYQAQRPTLNRGTSKPLPMEPLAEGAKNQDAATRDRRASVASITSAVQDDHYAVLPHGVSLDGWSEEDKAMLDDYVRHMLHSRREGFKRSMRAFGKYVRKPLGFFVTLYAVLITLFGMAWVIFLIGWIYVGEQQLYAINVIDNVLVALFAIVGDGLAPFRCVDTYHMGFIAYYHHLTEKIRKKRNLPKLQDENELPEIHESELDTEAGLKEAADEFSVLTPLQQKRLEHHQRKFASSHSFYKPHATMTHRAFPHHLFVAIVILLDMHSCLQISLGACTWGISYHTRPKALTPTILSFSITVNILAGVLIKVGDNKTRKKDVLARMFRQELTEAAMRKVEKKKESNNKKEAKEAQETKEAKEHGEKTTWSGGHKQPKDKLLPEDKIEEESESNRFSSASG